MAKSMIEEWAAPEKLLLLEAWARDGLTDEQIAANIGIHVRTLYEWKKRNQQIVQSLKKGEEVIDYEVENALLKKALGYTVKEEKLTKDGEVVELEREVPGDVTAQIFWLKNRKPEKWRNKPETDRADSTAEMLKNAQTLAEILRNPAPGRDIADFE